MTKIGARYLFQCKENYHNGIRPSCEKIEEEEGYQKLIKIAKEYFKKDRKSDFTNFFQEYQYCVNLWTAHLIIEYGNPDKKTEKEAIEVIERYSQTPLDEELAQEEKKWLDNYLHSKSN